MGEAKARRTRSRQFLVEHPWCCFCGGSVPATTIEHAPPIVFFINKQRPPTHEFPSCYRCNNGSSQLDQVAALAALTMGGVANSRIPDDYFRKIVAGVANNEPDVIRLLTRETVGTYVKSRGLLHPAVAAKVHRDLFRRWLDPWAVKQALALWYLYSREVLPSSGRVFVAWFSNFDVWMSRYPKELLGKLPQIGMLKAGKKTSHGQYVYRYFVPPERDFSVFVLCLYEGAVVFLGVYKDSLSFPGPIRQQIYATDALLGIHPVRPAPTGHCG